MKTDPAVNRPTYKVLALLTWSFLWRAIGITALIYIGGGLIASGLFYVAFVWCNAPLSVGEIIRDHFEIGVFILFIIALAMGPVLAFKMVTGKR